MCCCCAVLCYMLRHDMCDMLRCAVPCCAVLCYAPCCAECCALCRMLCCAVLCCAVPGHPPEDLNVLHYGAIRQDCMDALHRLQRTAAVMWVSC
jgi:hypothetical protein